MGAKPFRTTEPAYKRKRSRGTRANHLGMIGENSMQCFVGFLLGTATALTIPVTDLAPDDDVTPPVHHEHQVTERLNRAQLQYGVMPRPNPHWRWHWDAYYGRWVLRRPGYATV